MSDKLTIQVRYSCHTCGLAKVEATVPARLSEDVIVWVGQILGKALSEDHRRRSPNCQSGSCQDVYIPVNRADRIGGASVQ